ncbi:MAG TPA: hypothetical protein V6C72_06405, partial [Chroococcales cyanobacterium]
MTQSHHSDDNDRTSRQSRKYWGISPRNAPEGLILGILCGALILIASANFEAPVFPAALAGVGLYYLRRWYRLAPHTDAIRAVNAGENEKAIRLSELAIKRDPRNANTYITASAAYIRSANYRKGIELCEIALNLNPRSPLALTNRAAAHIYLGNVQDALVDSERAMELNPNSLYAAQNRACALEVLRRFEEAMVFYEKMLRLKPDSRYGYLGKGRIFLAMNQYKEARIACERVFELLLKQPSTD